MLNPTASLVIPSFAAAYLMFIHLLLFLAQQSSCPAQLSSWPDREER